LSSALCSCCPPASGAPPTSSTGFKLFQTVAQSMQHAVPHSCSSCFTASCVVSPAYLCPRICIVMSDKDTTGVSALFLLPRLSSVAQDVVFRSQLVLVRLIACISALWLCCL
jgi:hypothetical protein